MGEDMILRDRIARTIALADVTVHAEILNAEFARLVFDKRQISGYKSRAKTGAVFFVDQTAVAAEFAEADLIENRNRLNFAATVVVCTAGYPMSRT